MTTKVKHGSFILLLCALPFLSSAASVRQDSLGKVVDTVLRFVEGKEQEETVGNRWKIDSASPGFCNGLDCPHFVVLQNKTNYQLRKYIATKWASTNSMGVDYDAASRANFMRLFDYISGENAGKKHIAMAAPVLNRILPGPGPACADNFTMSFFMSPKEGELPKPSDPKVDLSQFPEMKVYVRSFGGMASKDDWLKEAAQLAEDLKGTGAKYHKQFYYTAGYDSPFKLFNRHNEIWFIAE